MLDEHWDIAIVGGGPNGLTAAAYLARSGARVVVLEGRFERGGTLATDDYSTPFTYNQAQFLLPLGSTMPPYRDLGLEAHGVSFIEPEVAAATTVGGDVLAVRRGGEGLGDEVEGLLAEADAAVTPLLYRPPAEAPSPRLGTMTPDDLVRAAGDERGAIILRYACALAGFPEGGAPLGALGAYALARLFAPTLAAGGSKSLANGLFRVAARAGARCLVSVPVVGVRTGEAGFELRLADGSRVHAGTVISTLDPITTVEGLLAEEAGESLTAIAASWKLDGSGPFTAHFGIRGEPSGAEVIPGQVAALHVIGFDSAQAVGDHLDAVSAGRLPARPAGHFTAVSRLDPLQASPGPYGPLHTLRYETPVPFENRDGGWDRHRIGFRDRCWSELRATVDGLEEATLLFAFADSPRDLERRFGTARRGSVRHGSLRPEQTFTARPHPSCAEGRTPIPGLYLGGGGIHPGIPGSLAGGYNVAAVVCEDLGLERWWPAAELRGDETAAAAGGHR